MGARRRAINKRGQGSGLREEILQAASRLLIAAAARDGITLRAIAREAGIAAPSVYPHFADRDAILDAVISRAFAQLAQVCADAADGAASGAGQVRAICRAYAEFAADQPGEYRILFERSPANVSRQPHPYLEGIAAFDLLIRALQRMVAEGASTSSDPRRDAQALWAAIHGLVTLVPATPGFPWRPADDLLDRLIAALSGQVAGRVARS